MSREIVLNVNRGAKPLDAFSSRHLQEFSVVGFSGTFEVMRRDLEHKRGLVTSRKTVEEVEVLEGTVYVQKIIKVEEPFGNTKVGALLTKIPLITKFAS